uniref:Putative alpha-L-fucosidase n=1 Tax=Trichuris muris TaxID=70415 RepID=A0A5S6QCI3_TRIMR
MMIIPTNGKVSICNNAKRQGAEAAMLGDGYDDSEGDSQCEATAATIWTIAEEEKFVRRWCATQRNPCIASSLFTIGRGVRFVKLSREPMEVQTSTTSKPYKYFGPSRFIGTLRCPSSDAYHKAVFRSSAVHCRTCVCIRRNDSIAAPSPRRAKYPDKHPSVAGEIPSHLPTTYTSRVSSLKAPCCASIAMEMVARLSLLLLLLVLPLGAGEFGQYTADWDSLDSRPLPQWYDDAKFGIFMHWGVYSVPSYHSGVWFWYSWQVSKDPKDVQFMRSNYKPDFEYADFASMFTCELFDSGRFAKVVRASGARYFVLTSKHHEGYAMWPSKYAWNWNSMDVGPHRDIVGELEQAFRHENIRFGLYFSLYEWFNSLYIQDKANKFKTKTYVKKVMMPQLMEIVNDYKPDILWSDGDWEAPDSYWNSTEFLAWLYNSSPVKDKVVVNDRWGKGTMCHHGGFLTCGDRFEPRTLQKRKWESCTTIDRDSWGYRREATLQDYHTIEELIEMLVRTVSLGGNLLLNVGPTHYGEIAPIFEERLAQIGEWLQVNGEAIYSTQPWKYQRDSRSRDVWYTMRRKNSHLLPLLQRNENVVYAIMLKWPASSILALRLVTPTPDTVVKLLGHSRRVPYIPLPVRGMEIDMTAVNQADLLSKWAWVIKIENAKD